MSAGPTPGQVVITTIVGIFISAIRLRLRSNAAIKPKTKRIIRSIIIIFGCFIAKSAIFTAAALWKEY
jgi:predicted naringenin-chalcone synthase